MALLNDLYLKVMNFLDRDEEGQGLAEYALILALIAIIAIVALIFLGQQVSQQLSNVGKSI
jgi:pilus assembly protein Flp/PilA